MSLGRPTEEERTAMTITCPTCVAAPGDWCIQRGYTQKVNRPGIGMVTEPIYTLVLHRPRRVAVGLPGATSRPRPDEPWTRDRLRAELAQILTDHQASGGQLACPPEEGADRLLAVLEDPDYGVDFEAEKDAAIAAAEQRPEAQQVCR